MIRLWRRLLRERRGSAAIEFAFVFPIMIAMFLGTYEVANAVIIYMKVVDAADTVSDLVAQYKTVSTSDLNNIYIAAQLVMQPASGSGLQLAIASVTFDPSTGNAGQAWQVERGGAAPMTDDASAAVGLGSPGDSVIEAMATYTYTSLFQFVLPHGITMSARIFNRPRAVASVACTAPCN